MKAQNQIVLANSTKKLVIAKGASYRLEGNTVVTACGQRATVTASAAKVLAAYLTKEQQEKFLRDLQKEVPELKGLKVQLVDGEPSLLLPATGEEVYKKLKESLKRIGWSTWIPVNSLARADRTWPLSINPTYYEVNERTGHTRQYIRISAPKVDGSDVKTPLGISAKMAAIAKKIFPSTGTYNHTDGAEWRARGGHAGSKTLVAIVKRAEANGFSEVKSSSNGRPDGATVGGSTEYTTEDGIRLSVHSSYGYSARDNSFSAELSYKPAYRT